jgi:fructokinase
MNCAIALSRLGNDTGFLCPISSDSFGDYILKPLTGAGVKPLLTERVREPTTLAVVTDDGKGNPRYAFYREADRAFTRDGLIAALPQKLEVFQAGGFCPIEPEDARVWLDVTEEALARGATISIDPNVRPALVADMESYRARLSSFLDLAHIVKASEEDLHELDPALTLEEQARRLLKRPNCELVVVTLGAEGSMGFTRSGSFRAPIYPATPGGDNVGAGDTLMAAILTWLADHKSLAPEALGRLDAGALEQMLWFGAVAAGINCSRIGPNPPTRAEEDAVIPRS